MFLCFHSSVPLTGEADDCPTLERGGVDGAQSAAASAVFMPGMSPNARGEDAAKRPVTPHTRVHLQPFAEQEHTLVAKPPPERPCSPRSRHHFQTRPNRFKLSAVGPHPPPAKDSARPSYVVKPLTPKALLQHLPAPALLSLTDGSVVTESGLIKGTRTLRIVSDRPATLSARGSVLPLLRGAERDTPALGAGLRQGQGLQPFTGLPDVTATTPGRPPLHPPAETVSESLDGGAFGATGPYKAPGAAGQTAGGYGVAASSTLSATASEPSGPVSVPVDRRDSQLQEDMQKLFETSHNKHAEGMGASALSMAAPRTWAMVKQQLEVVTRRSRRSSNAVTVNNLQYTPLDAATPPCSLPPLQALSMLGKIPWVSKLSNSELRTLFGRCQLVHFPKGSLVLRESSRGTGFYLLVVGRLFAASKRRDFDVLLTEGMSFGETALIPDLRVRREATVGALKDSWCLRMRASALADMPCSSAIDELYRIYFAKALGSIPWFSLFVPSKLLEVAQCLELENLPPSRAVFHQGDTVEKM